jgi:hypothetical protein
MCFWPRGKVEDALRACRTGRELLEALPLASPDIQRHLAVAHKIIGQALHAKPDARMRSRRALFLSD